MFTIRLLLTILLATCAVFDGVAQAKRPTGSPAQESGNADIFEQMEAQGVDLNQPLLYGYFFFDRDKAKLTRLGAELTKQGYRQVSLEKTDDGRFRLHAEKVERHTLASLRQREQQLRPLARRFGVALYDGFDVGNADPTKPLITDEGFRAFVATKKGESLFRLGMKLYDLRLIDKAEVVFRQCRAQQLKPDTTALKLGNLLLHKGNTAEGVSLLEECTKLNPRMVGAFFNLGATYYDNEQYQKSIDNYEQANKLRPNDDATVYGIAAAQYALGQFDRARTNCQQALKLNPANENAQVLQTMLDARR